MQEDAPHVVKKEKKRSKADKSENDTISKHVIPNVSRHKKPTLDTPAPNVAPISGSQLVSNNVFNNGKDL